METVTVKKFLLGASFVGVMSLAGPALASNGELVDREEGATPQQVVQNLAASTCIEVEEPQEAKSPVSLLLLVEEGYSLLHRINAAAMEREHELNGQIEAVTAKLKETTGALEVATQETQQLRVQIEETSIVHQSALEGMTKEIEVANGQIKDLGLRMEEAANEHGRFVEGLKAQNEEQVNGLFKEMEAMGSPHQAILAERDAALEEKEAQIKGNWEVINRMEETMGVDLHKVIQINELIARRVELGNDTNTPAFDTLSIDMSIELLKQIYGIITTENTENQ